MRSYREEDRASVRSLHVRALEAAGAYTESGPWDSDLDNIPSVYMSKGVFIVGEVEAAIIAMGALKFVSRETAELKRMRVDPTIQGRGLGKIILGVLEQKALQLGFTTIQLDTTEVQVAAQSLYERNGYLEINREKKVDLVTIYYSKRLIA